MLPITHKGINQYICIQIKSNFIHIPNQLLYKLTDKYLRFYIFYNNKKYVEIEVTNLHFLHK